MKKFVIAIFLVIVVVAGANFLFTDKKEEINNNKSTENVQGVEHEVSQEKTMQKPELTINQNKEYTATIKTSEGDIVVSLNAKETPITANNFIYLSREGFYNDTIFHRVIDGFMIQGGDPTGTGSGGPGYEFDDEPFTGEYERGVIAMANHGANTNGSQFFIMHQDYALPKNYVIFGKVTKGLEVVDKIATAEVAMSRSTGEESEPVNPVKITSIEIEEK